MSTRSELDLARQAGTEFLKKKNPNMFFQLLQKLAGMTAAIFSLIFINNLIYGRSMKNHIIIISSE